MSRSRCSQLGIVSAAALSLMMIQGADAGSRCGDYGLHRRGDQDTTQVEGPDQEHHPRMLEALGLSEEPQTQLNALHLAHRSEMEDLRANQPQGRRGQRGDGQRSSRRLSGASHRGGGPGGGALFNAAVNLSEEQKTAIQQLRASLRSEMQDLRASGDGSRAVAQVLFEQHREQVNALLSEAQVATLERLRNKPQAQNDGRHHGPHRGWQPIDDDGTAEAAAKPSIETGTWGLLKKSID